MISIKLRTVTILKYTTRSVYNIYAMFSVNIAHKIKPFSFQARRFIAFSGCLMFNEQFVMFRIIVTR
jgi:hypothetical protein